MIDLIEVTVLNYLKSVLDVPVRLEIPAQLPSKFVCFFVKDRSKKNLINAVTLEFYSYSNSKYEAMVLDKQVREAMENITDLDDISASTLGGGNDTNDTSLKKYRYRSYYNITY